MTDITTKTDAARDEAALRCALAVVEHATDIDEAEVADMSPARIARLLAFYAPDAVETLTRLLAWRLEGASRLDCSPERIVAAPWPGWEPSAFWRGQAAEALGGAR